MIKEYECCEEPYPDLGRPDAEWPGKRSINLMYVTAAESVGWLPGATMVWYVGASRGLTIRREYSLFMTEWCGIEYPA